MGDGGALTGGRIAGGQIVLGHREQLAVDAPAVAVPGHAHALGVVSAASFPAARERRLDLLADLVEEHLDVDALLGLVQDGVPLVQVLPPGDARRIDEGQPVIPDR